MELQLHDGHYGRKKAYNVHSSIKRNTAKKMLAEMYGTPTYYQFLSEENLTGLEEDELLAGRFGNWLKGVGKGIGKGFKKVGDFAVKAQSALSPIIGVLPGGGLVNAAFDVVKTVQQPGQPATVEPIVTPMPTATPPMPTMISPGIMPAPIPTPSFMPATMPTPIPAPMPAPIPQFFPNPFMQPEIPSRSGLFGMDTKTLVLLGLGGILAFKLLSK